MSHAAAVSASKECSSGGKGSMSLMQEEWAFQEIMS
jgi:hypothetical protein